MNPSSLIRDAGKVHQHLKEMRNGSLVTARKCSILVPGRYLEKQLTTISNEIHTVGIFAIVMEDKHYGVSLTNAMMRIEPDSTNTILIDDEEYVEFIFEPGSTLLPSTDLVRSDTLLYQIYDEFIAKGRVPWFMTYEDLGSLFDSSEKHAGVRLGANHAILEMIASAISRDPDDPSVFYRQTVKSMEDLRKRPPEYIAFKNISYGASNTTAKLMGAYWNDGLTSALVNPADKVEDIEELLRR